MKTKIKVGKKMTRLILDEAMNIIEDYLNAGDKKTRKEAHEKAKSLYFQYYGVEYKNRNEVEACGPEPIPEGLKWKLISSEGESGKLMSDVPKVKLTFQVFDDSPALVTHKRIVFLNTHDLFENREFLPPYKNILSSKELEIIERYQN